MVLKGSAQSMAMLALRMYGQHIRQPVQTVSSYPDTDPDTNLGFDIFHAVTPATLAAVDLQLVSGRTGLVFEAGKNR